MIKWRKDILRGKYLYNNNPTPTPTTQFLNPHSSLPLSQLYFLTFTPLNLILTFLNLHEQQIQLNWSDKKPHIPRWIPQSLHHRCTQHQIQGCGLLGLLFGPQVYLHSIVCHFLTAKVSNIFYLCSYFSYLSPPLSPSLIYLLSLISPLSFALFPLTFLLPFFTPIFI